MEAHCRGVLGTWTIAILTHRSGTGGSSRCEDRERPFTFRSRQRSRMLSASTSVWHPPFAPKGSAIEDEGDGFGMETDTRGIAARRDTARFQLQSGGCRGHARAPGRENAPLRRGLRGTARSLPVRVSRPTRGGIAEWAISRASALQPGEELAVLFRVPRDPRTARKLPHQCADDERWWQPDTAHTAFR